jgi:hypothetical protein
MKMPITLIHKIRQCKEEFQSFDQEFFVGKRVPDASFVVDFKMNESWLVEMKSREPTLFERDSKRQQIEDFSFLKTGMTAIRDLLTMKVLVDHAFMVQISDICDFGFRLKIAPD